MSEGSNRRVARPGETVTGSGVVEVVPLEEGVYEFRSYSSAAEARESGVADADVLFDPDPEGCDWNCEINPSGPGFVWTCRVTTCSGRCTVWIREPGGDWQNKGERWEEREVLRGWHRCGCTPAA